MKINVMKVFEKKIWFGFIIGNIVLLIFLLERQI